MKSLILNKIETGVGETTFEITAFDSKFVDMAKASEIVKAKSVFVNETLIVRTGDVFSVIQALLENYYVLNFSMRVAGFSADSYATARQLQDRNLNGQCFGHSSLTPNGKYYAGAKQATYQFLNTINSFYKKHAFNLLTPVFVLNH